MSTKNNLLRNSRRFHGELFEFEILEIFTTVFSLETIIWTWIFFQALQSALFKNAIKNLLKKMQVT